MAAMILRENAVAIVVVVTVVVLMVSWWKESVPITAVTMKAFRKRMIDGWGWIR